MIIAGDDEVRGVWQALGLPGIFDVHVHFMPRRLMAAVWRYFDAAGPLTARSWPISYKLTEPERLDVLRSLGVRRFPSLVYPHKPGMAESLNEWAAAFAAQVPECVRTATFFPEPQATSYVENAIDTGARIFKAHIQVGGYDPRAPELVSVWGRLAEAGVPCVVHAGSGPAPGPFTGPDVFGEVLRAHPALTAVIAHLGGPEHAQFMDLAERYPNVYLDTSMTLVPFVHNHPAELAPRMRDLGDRILFGSDFPNIPHAYAEQVAGVVRLDLGDEWLRAVLWGNAARLFGG